MPFFVQTEQLHCDNNAKSTFARKRTRPQWQPPSRCSSIIRTPRLYCRDLWLFGLLHDGLERPQSVRQGGRAWLQDDRRLDFVKRAALDGRDLCEAGPRGDLLGPEFLAAPRTDDEVGRPGDDLIRRHDA